MSATNDRAASDPDVAERLADYRLIDALDRYCEGHPVTPDEIECCEVGAEEQERLMRRLLRVSKDYGQDRISRDALRLEFHAIFIHMKLAAYMQGMFAGLRIGERRHEA